MITTPIFTRVLSEEQYGLVNTFFSWQTVLIMIISLSLYKALMNLYVKDDNKEKVLSAICGLTIVLTTAGFLIYLIFNRQIANAMQMCMITKN